MPDTKNFDFANLKSDILRYIASRGFLDKITHLNELDIHLSSKKEMNFYIGFDCTSDSLHAGHLMHLKLIETLTSYSNINAIILLGGATSAIGDPSGKESTRKFLLKNEVKENFLSIKKQLEKFFSGNKKIKILNNIDWFDDIKFCDFMRKIGSNFSVNKMISFDTFRRRLQNESNLSFMEFSYVLMQAYDFVYLADNFNCILQIGGSDQWANIISGVELYKKINKKQIYGITTPLLLTSSGKKMGKTEKGTVWLDENKFSISDFWQFFRNISDLDLKKWLLIFTNLDESYVNSINSVEEINNAKKVLATTVTSICHGEDKAKYEQERFEQIFMHKSYCVKEEDCFYVDCNERICDILVKLNFARSKKFAKDLIRHSAVKINDKLVLNVDSYVSEFFPDVKLDLKNIKTLKLSVGKKKIAFLKS